MLIYVKLSGGALRAYMKRRQLVSKEGRSGNVPCQTLTKVGTNGLLYTSQRSVNTFAITHPHVVYENIITVEIIRSSSV